MALGISDRNMVHLLIQLQQINFLNIKMESTVI